MANAAGDYIADTEDAVSFHQIFERRVQENPLKRAILIAGRSATYSELDSMANCVAAWLVDRGIDPGTHVAVYFPISVEAVACALGILKAGCVLVTNHPGFSHDKLVRQINSSECRILVTESDTVIGEVLSRTGVEHGLLIGGAGASCDARVTRFEHIQTPQSQFTPGFAGSRERHAAIFHTTGSTFEPKGVVISHGNMIAAFRSITTYLNSRPSDVVLHYASFSFDFGFYNTVMPLLFGGSSVAGRAIPESAAEILATIQAEHVTALHFMPPVIFQLCKADALSSATLASVRYISSTGQRLPTKYIRHLRRAAPHVDILSMYGMNEATRIAYLPPSEIDHRPTSVGKAIPGVKTFLVDECGALLTGAGRVGELAVSGELVMQGYWKLPDLNARVLRNNLFGEDRVFFTGDMFRTDEDGYLYYVARKDDVFTRSMFQVNPKEIEDYLLAFDGVAEAAVVPIAEPGVGHVPKAYVVLEPRAHGVTERALIEHCARGMDWHMVPTAIEFRESLPRSSSGKTSTNTLAAILDAESEMRTETAPVDELYLKNTSMLKLAVPFDDIATGRTQVPRRPVRTEMLSEINDPEIFAYHDLLTARTGPLFSHFLASIPYILEELCRVGVALTRLSERRSAADDRAFTFFEADAFDGSNGRALNAFSGGRITTLTNSPNPANGHYFHAYATTSQCSFFPGTFLEVNKRLLTGTDELRRFASGFDYIYETAALQFYGKDRDLHVGHIASLLREDGLALFMHKLSHSDSREFERRELTKDECFKTKYFTHDEIEWKRLQMLDQMHTGLIDRDETVRTIKRYFKHAALIWNSGNFHEIVASNDGRMFDQFLSLLHTPVIPREHCTEELGVV